MSSSAREILDRIALAAERAGRRPADINLLPVSKMQSIETIRAVFAADELPRRLGESYLEELKAKHAEFGSDFEWHFIGRLQSRKIRELCSLADCLHTVSRNKELAEIAAQARKPRFFIQVNVSSEDQKNGCLPTQLAVLLDDCARLGLESLICGLMALPSDLDLVGEAHLRREFSLLRELRDRHLPGKSLNMGMSGDFEIAISEGADWVRIGSALFGARQYPNQ